MLDYRIQTFLAVCETMNYRSAAGKLNITQPAVTQHIHYLEQYYGCNLFKYDGRTLIKSVQAEILEKYINSMNYQEQKLLEELHSEKGLELSIGATKTIGEFVIAEQVKNFLKVPDNRLKIAVDNTENILSLLDRGELDFAIVEGYFDKLSYDSVLYRKEPFVGLCGKNHPFAGKTIPADMVWSQDILVREEGSGTRKILERILERNNYTINNFKRTICVGNFGLLEKILESGSGITFAYKAAGSNNKNLEEFYVEGWEVSREFDYVFLPNTEAEKLVEIFDSFRY